MTKYMKFISRNLASTTISPQFEFLRIKCVKAILCTDM